MKIRFSTLGSRRPGAEQRAARAARLVLGRDRIGGSAARISASGAPGAAGSGRGRAPGKELHIVWTTRRRLRVLSRRFLGKDHFTDVIAFRYPPGRGSSPFEPRGARALAPFGDLYIAVDQARINARRFGAGVDEEIVRLAAHGTLHLLGYTDHAPGQRRRMWAVQEPIVRKALGRSRRPPPA